MGASRSISLWWLVAPGLALLLALLAWGRLAWVGVHNISPPHALNLEGEDGAPEAEWFRCHPKQTVIDGPGLWAVWQCGLGSEGRAHLVRLDLDKLQIQRRWSLPAPYAEAQRLKLWGMLTDGEDRILLLEHAMPKSGRFPKEQLLAVKVKPAGGVELLAFIPRESESAYSLLAWDRGPDGFDFVYEDGKICRLRQGDAWNCAPLWPEIQGDRRHLGLEAVWRDKGAWWAVWKKKHDWNAPDDLVLLGPGEPRPLEGVTAKRQELDRIAGHVIRLDGRWQVRDGRLFLPTTPALPDEEAPPYFGGTPILRQGRLERQHTWRGDKHQQILEMEGETFRLDMGFDGLRFGRDLSRPGPLKAHEDLTAVINTYPVRHGNRFWILHHHSLSTVVMDEDLTVQPLGFKQRFLRLLPSSQGEQERLMGGVGPNIMAFRGDLDHDAELLFQFLPILLMPLWPLLLLLLAPFWRRFAFRVSLNVAAGAYLFLWLVFGRNYWLITSWF